MKYLITPTPPTPELLQRIFNEDDLTIAELSADWPNTLSFAAATRTNAVCDRVCIRRLGSDQTLVVTGAEATVLWGELARSALPLNFTDAPPRWQTLLPHTADSDNQNDAMVRNGSLV
ncbi:MAG: hypothetical protein M9930_07525 [Anaerolineae bacterium]|nr:hypothetical protein [Anaerolineae bacterium]